MNEVIIILNLFVLETLLSIDNAAVLAVMVKDLPKDQQPKALRYGLIGAFLFRGICLVLACWLIQILWLKIIGGAYLLWIAVKHFFISENETQIETKQRGFWMTVLMVEFMDIAFSMDNVFAAVAFTSNIWLIMVGVFLGIVSMRFIAQKFTNLLNKYPSLTNSAFLVILFLGVKLVLSGVIDTAQILPGVQTTINSHSFDLVFSVLMIIIFLIPILKVKKA